MEKFIEILIVSCQIEGSVLISHKREKFWKSLTTKHIIPQVMPPTVKEQGKSFFFSKVSIARASLSESGKFYVLQGALLREGAWEKHWTQITG